MVEQARGAVHLCSPARSEVAGRRAPATGASRVDGSVIDGMPSLIAVVDDRGCIIDVNQAWSDECHARGGNPAACGVGANYLSVCEEGGDSYGLAAGAGLRRVLNGELPSYQLDYPCHRFNVQQWFSLRIGALPGGARAVLSHVDITARHRAMAVLKLQTEVLELLASGASLSTCLNHLAGSIEELSPPARCSIMLVDREGCMRVAAAPRLPSAFLDSIEGLRPGPMVGSCGTAVHEGRRVITSEIATDQAWEPFRSGALAHGLQACWSSPIMPVDGGGALGAFALYYDQPRAPTADEVELVELFSQLAGFAVERDTRTQELARIEAETAAVLSAAADGIIIVGIDGLVRSANPSAGRMFAEAPDALTGVPVAKLLAPVANDPESAPRPIGRARQLPGLAAVAVRPGGGEFPVEMSISEHDLVGGWLTTVTLRDVTERRAFEARLAHQASHDALTGLPNRGAIVERLKRAIAAAPGESVVVLCLDLDRFKVINDSLGHHNGDRLLTALGERLTAALPDSLVGRLGGDEFAVVCAGHHLDIGRVCALVAGVVAKPLDIGGRRLTTSTSIGVALGTTSEATAESLLHDADVALYQAKSDGGARYCLFDEALRGRALQRLELEEDLVAGLAGGQFRLAYQPQIQLSNGAIVGVEVLLRWDHPTRGPVPPSDFVVIAEQIGLIIPLGAWVLSTALHEAARWHRQLGRPLSISINVSARQVEHPSLVDDVRLALDATSYPPASVCLEITETDFLHDQSLPVLRDLKELGVRIALDDFGVGFASLDYLRRFPVADQLKIDRSFTDELGRDGGNSAITSAIVALAHSLGMESVGEGIERPEQLDALTTLGCDLGQGYFTGLPMSGEEFLDLVRQSS